MITGKDKRRTEILEARNDHSKRLYAILAEDLRSILEALDSEGVNITRDPYWKLAYDAGACEEMAKICSE